MELSRQEYWSGLPFPPRGDVPNPGIKPKSIVYCISCIGRQVATTSITWEALCKLCGTAKKKKKNSLETMPSEIPEALYPFSHYTVHHHSGNYMSSQLCYKDSSGWGSGFICVSFILCVQLLSHVRLFATPWTVVYQSPPGKNTGVGCHFLLQGSSWPKDWTHVSLCLLHWQADSFPLALPGKPYPRYILKNP